MALRQRRSERTAKLAERTRSSGGRQRPRGSQGHLAAISGRPRAAFTAAGPRPSAARREHLGAARPVRPRLRNRYRGTERTSATAKFKGSPSSRAGRGEPPAAPPSPHAGGGAAPCRPGPHSQLQVGVGRRRRRRSRRRHLQPSGYRRSRSAPRLPAGLTRPAGLRRRSLARDKPPRAQE